MTTSTSADDLDLRGSLGTTAVADVLQFLHVGSRTGALQVSTAEGVAGVAWLRDGQLYHATTDTDSGLPALAEMMGWKQGGFAFSPGAADPMVTIDAPLQVVLMEAAQLLDERQQQPPEPPSIDTQCEARLADFIAATSASFAVVLAEDGSPRCSAGDAAELDVDAMAAAFAEIDHGAAFLATVLSATRQGELIIQFDRYEVMLMTEGAVRLAVLAPESARLGVIRHKTKQLLHVLTSMLEPVS